MNETDSLQRLMIDFFNLSPTTPAEDLTQMAVPNWDSLAMVQLIAELQSAYQVRFDLEEIECLASYADIRASLLRKGVRLYAERIG